MASEAPGGELLGGVDKRLVDLLRAPPPLNTQEPKLTPTHLLSLSIPSLDEMKCKHYVALARTITVCLFGTAPDNLNILYILQPIGRGRQNKLCILGFGQNKPSLYYILHAQANQYHLLCPHAIGGLCISVPGCKCAPLMFST